MTTSTGDVGVLNGIAAKKKAAQMCRTMATAARRFDGDELRVILTALATAKIPRRDEPVLERVLGKIDEMLKRVRGGKKNQKARENI